MDKDRPSGCNGGLQKLTGTDFGSKRTQVNVQSTPKTKGMTPRRNPPVPECQSQNPSGSPQAFPSPRGNADVPAAQRHLSPALPRLPSPGTARGTQGGQPGWSSRSPVLEDGQLGIWLLLIPLQRQDAASRLGAIILGDGDWATAGGKPRLSTQTAKIQKGSGWLGSRKVGPVSPRQQEAAPTSSVGKKLNGPQFKALFCLRPATGQDAAAPWQMGRGKHIAPLPALHFNLP